jgi:hypothetical protein
VAIAGISSIGLMVAVNFLIGSDFKWLLVSFSFPWAFALVLYPLERGAQRPAPVSPANLPPTRPRE